MPPPPRVVVLGPQRRQRTLDVTLEDIGLARAKRYATVTAGWEEREGEDQELDEHLKRRSVNLRLFERSEAVLASEPELLAGTRWRAERLRELQELYRVRLVHTLEAARELFRREPAPRTLDLLESAREAAIENLRALDREHEERVSSVREEFESRWRPAELAGVARAREELARILERCACLCVAGGHVAALLEALRLFDFGSLVGERPIVCWSAGAMALSERVVLFHDDPPQGAGSAEVLERGLALHRGLLPLPHARARLRLDDPLRVALFARRFEPLLCTALVEGGRVDWDGRRWRAPGDTRLLTSAGELVRIGA